MNSMDKEIQRLQEQLVAVRSEKETLEGVLFDTQTNLESTEMRRLQLDKEHQELIVKQEHSRNEVSRLSKDLQKSEKRCAEVKISLSQQAGDQEETFARTIADLKKTGEEETRKLLEEKEKLRVALEKRLQQTLQQLTHEKDAEIEKLLGKVENLQNYIDNLCQQHEELMLRAENDKQQALLLGMRHLRSTGKHNKRFAPSTAQHDHQAIHDRLEATKRELEVEKDTLERLKREANSRFDADRTVIIQLRDDLNKQKTKLEESRWVALIKSCFSIEKLKYLNV